MFNVNDVVEIQIPKFHSKRKHFNGMKGVIERITSDYLAFRVKFTKTADEYSPSYVKHIGDEFCETFPEIYLKAV